MVNIKDVAGESVMVTLSRGGYSMSVFETQVGT